MSNIELSKICQTLSCINLSMNGFPYQSCARDRVMQNFDRNEDALIGKEKFVPQDSELN
jgi:hypothetical protein